MSSEETRIADLASEGWPEGLAPYDPSENPNGPGGLVVPFERPTDVPMSLPNNTDVEQRLLSCLLFFPKCYEQIAGLTKPEHFYDPRNAALFEEIVAVIEAGDIPTPVTLPRALVEAVGGIKFLQETHALAWPQYAKTYARTLEEKFLAREIAIRNDEAGRRVRDGEDPKAVASQLSRELDDLTASAETNVVSIGTAAERAITQAEAAYKRDGALAGIATGFSELDHKTGGLEPGALIILAARPSMGKTALATSIGLNAARHGKPVVFFSAEMSEVQIGRRLTCGLTGISLIDAKNGALDAGAFERLERARYTLSKLPFTVDEARDLSEIKAHCRVQARRGLGLVIIDHIGLVSVDDGIARQGRTAVVTHITAELKQLAKELKVPIVALSQLSRANEQREEKRPQLSDLRDSGSLEQDADIVMFVYREHYYIERAKPSRRPDEAGGDHAARMVTWSEAELAARGRAELILAKNRDGAIGTIELAFDERTARFRPITQDEAA